MSLTKLSENIYCYDLGVTLVGVLINGTSATLIDCGMTKQHGKMLEKAIGLPITSIICTHYHHDHIGAAAYLQKKHNAKVYLPATEKALVKASLGADLMHGGPVPVAYKKPVDADSKICFDDLPDGAFTDANGFFITPIPTYGHSLQHTAYLIDDILFLGDALSSPELITRHKLLYMFNSGQAYEALESMPNISFSRAVIAHKAVIDKQELIRYTDIEKQHIEAIEREILGLLDKHTVEELAAALIEKLGLPAFTMESVFLSTSTLRGYLSKLENSGLAAPDAFNGYIRWQKTDLTQEK